MTVEPCSYNANPLGTGKRERAKGKPQTDFCNVLHFLTLRNAHVAQARAPSQLTTFKMFSLGLLSAVFRVFYSALNLKA